MISLDKLKLMYGGNVINIDSNTFVVYTNEHTIVISEFGETRLGRGEVLGRSRNLILIGISSRGHLGLILSLKNLENHKSEIIGNNVRVIDQFYHKECSKVDIVLNNIKMCNRVCIYKLDTKTDEFMLLDYNLDVVDRYKCSIDTNYIDYTQLDTKKNFSIAIGNINCDKYFIKGNIDEGKIYGEYWQRD